MAKRKGKHFKAYKEYEADSAGAIKESPEKLEVIQPPVPSLPAIVKKKPLANMEIRFNYNDQSAPMSLDIMSGFLSKDQSNMSNFLARDNGGVVYSKEQSNYPLPKKTQEQKVLNETIGMEKAEETIKIEDATPATFKKDADVWYKKFNAEFKSSKTVKLLVYGVQKNQVMIRLSNLEDNFDGMKAKSIKFDVNAWAREFYLEANSHLSKKNTTTQLLQGIRLNITEMNLAGSIPKYYFNTSLPQAKWIAQGSLSNMTDANDTDTKQPKTQQLSEQMEKLEKEPQDNIQFIEVERAKGSTPGLPALWE